MALNFSTEDVVKITMDWVVDTILIPHFNELGYQGGTLNATGEWIENLNTRAEGVTGIINGRQYTEQLVWGRRPGLRPPIAPLERWAQIKLGLSGQEALGAAFAIANKIAKEGTEIYKDGGTDLLEILEAPETISRINEFLANQLQTKVQLFLEREIQSV